MENPILIPEFKYLESKDYEYFDEKVYEEFCKMSFAKYQFFSELVHSDINLKHKCNYINCFQYDWNTTNITKLCEEKYENDYFSKILFHDDKISFDFISFEDLFENLTECKSRYYPIINMIHIPGLESAHCTLFILDKKNNKAFLFDSNGDIMTYYANYFENVDITRFHFHMVIKKLFEQIGFDYIPSLELGISKSINKINYETNHKNFFKGFCMAYSFLVADLCVMSDNNNKEIKDILDKIYKLNDFNKNNLINRYHSYVHSIISALLIYY